MKIKELILPTLISIIPAGLIILNIVDLKDLFASESEYPFGSEFVTAYSIYTSEKIYVLYNVFFTTILLLAIYFAFKQKRKLCLTFLFVGAMLFLYPLLTASN